MKDLPKMSSCPERKSLLSGKVILITGASSGIGAGTATHLASFNTRLSLVARSKEALEKVKIQCLAAGAREVMTLSYDLAEENNCELAVSETVQQFKSLDVLVNCAGILVTGSVDCLSTADYDKVMNLNTRSAFILTRASTPHLVTSQGNIIHVSSVAGIRSFPSLVGYCISKAAMDQLVRCSAVDLASKGVRVNAVNPGVIKTEIFHKGGITGEIYDTMMEEECKSHPIGRVGNVEEVASMIGFLASSEASFITGQTVGIDGGRALRV